MSGKIGCVACNYPHTKEFPEGFPDEWKLCCTCLGWAEIIIKGNRCDLEEVYKGYNKEFFGTVMRELDNIEKLISLVV